MSSSLLVTLLKEKDVETHRLHPFADSAPIFFLSMYLYIYIYIPIVGIFYESPPFLNLLCQ